MLYNKHNMAVTKIAAKSDMRPEIAGVFFTGNKTVATDSFRLIEITTPSDVKAEDFPQIDGAHAMRGHEPFILSARELKDIKIPNSKNMPALNHFAIKHIDDNKVELMTSDLKTSSVKGFRRVDGTFPEYNVLFPKGEPVAEVVINGEYFAEVAQILADMAGGAHNEITLKFYAGNKPLVMEAKSKVQEGRALIMPVFEH